MIRHEQRGKLAVLTLDRPGKANALTLAMLQDLTARLEGLARDGTRVVVLTGAGKVFSAGADLDEARQGLALSDQWAALSGQVAAMPCLTIAALNGTLAGGAFGMVLACDLRIAVPEAEFFYPVMRLGYLPPRNDPERLLRLIGPARAKMILMAGARIGAPEALAWGLVDRIEARDHLMAAAEDLAAPVLAAAEGHAAAMKARINAADQSPALL